MTPLSGGKGEVRAARAVIAATLLDSRATKSLKIPLSERFIYLLIETEAACVLFQRIFFHVHPRRKASDA
jgi:hypothetical protein